VGTSKGLIGILGPVEIVGAEDLISWSQVVVDAPENGSVADRVVNGTPSSVFLILDGKGAS